ncbi:alpha/beta hydrolase [Dyadobacter subterraneus]|uniref:Alpha/beta hydrolase n=1 Tax=Dyadobacter subterraneus TaxID=2773304 RepID=A0ABR9W7V9_9BACT|nr:alpha/beta hydrolase [Dyadobacter subterraneus]MBE9461545.1 alpha/beta hydrolase [Dyadobacter subterraneus]
MLKTLLIVFCSLTLHLKSLAFEQVKQDTIPTILTYKKIDTLDLNLTIYKPADFSTNKKYPAIIFFFGGGWINGNISQFKNQALYFASRGMIAVLCDYRVASRNHTSPFDAVADAKSAIRYLRLNATNLHIDPKRIAAAGGSAGGHLAAAADLTKLEDSSADRTISARPNALVLFNPVFNNGPGEYGYDRIGERYPEISPFHNITKGAAPTIVFFGTKDKLVSVETAKAYQSKMKQNGNRCDLYFYPEQVHGFFNKGEYYLKTLNQADIFLESIGYIRGKPTI